MLFAVMRSYPVNIIVLSIPELIFSHKLIRVIRNKKKDGVSLKVIHNSNLRIRKYIPIVLFLYIVIIGFVYVCEHENNYCVDIRDAEYSSNN